MLPVSGLDFSWAASSEKSVIKGSVNDVSGRAAGGTNIYIYNSPDVRRPADFIAHTGKDGRFRISLPSGKYWAVARLKRSDGYGPLMSGDKHSGEPVEIALASGAELEVEFTIKDLNDAVSLRRKTREDIIKIEGRIIDINGRPVNMAYAIANRNDKVTVIPGLSVVMDRCRRTLRALSTPWKISFRVCFQISAGPKLCEGERNTS